MKKLMNDIIELGVVEVNDKIYACIDEAKEMVYAGLIPKAEYISESMCFKTESISAIEDWDKLDHPVYNALKDQMEKSAQKVHKVINGASKL